MSKRTRPRNGVEAKRRRTRIAARLRRRWARQGHYVFEHKRIVPVSLLTWARWFESPRRFLRSTTVGNVRVSTIFLGLDHSFGHGPPILFESATIRTDVPRPDGISVQNRYASYREAMCDHVRLVAEVAAGVQRIDGERG